MAKRYDRLPGDIPAGMTRRDYRSALGMRNVPPGLEIPSDMTEHEFASALAASKLDPFPAEMFREVGGPDHYLKQLKQQQGKGQRGYKTAQNIKRAINQNDGSLSAGNRRFIEKNPQFFPDMFSGPNGKLESPNTRAQRIYNNSRLAPQARNNSRGFTDAINTNANSLYQLQGDIAPVLGQQNPNFLDYDRSGVDSGEWAEAEYQANKVRNRPPAPDGYEGDPMRPMSRMIKDTGSLIGNDIGGWLYNKMNPGVNDWLTQSTNQNKISESVPDAKRYVLDGPNKTIAQGSTQDGINMSNTRSGQPISTPVNAIGRQDPRNFGNLYNNARTVNTNIGSQAPVQKTSWWNRGIPADTDAYRKLYTER